MPRKRGRRLKELNLKEPSVHEEMLNEEPLNENWSTPLDNNMFEEEGLYVRCPSCGTVVEVSLEAPECPVCGADLTDEIYAVLRGEVDEESLDEEEI